VAHILLVDDNRELAENIAELLQDAGHTSVIFIHPIEALACFAPLQYQVAILDCKMPEIDGVELYRRLRKRDPDLPALLITAYDGKDCLLEAASEGIKAVISKPIDLRTFIDTISKFLRAA
jgi:CheY-like chemotaxis protein